MSIGSVIKSVQNVASKLLGGSQKPATMTIPRPAPIPILKPLNQINYVPLQTIKPITGKNDPQAARNSAIMAANNRSMSGVSSQMASNKSILEANARAIAAAAAEKERRRKEAQDSFDRWKKSYTEKNKTEAQRAAEKGATGDKAYDLAYSEAYKKALADFDKQKQAGNKNLFQSAWDKVSFGQDRRDSGARKYAERKASEYADKSVKEYQKKLDKFLKDQAAQKAKIESTRFSTEAEFNKAADAYMNWQNTNIGGLQADAGRITASLDAYGVKSTSKLNSAPMAAAGWLNRKVVQGVPGKAFGNIFKYTLGSGSKNIPSVVTAPGRVVNWVGNLNTKDRTIYQSGGTSTNRTNSKLNAWQAGFNQRNFNIRPVVDKPYDKSAAWKELTSGKTGGSIQQVGYWQKFKSAKNDNEKEKIAQDYWKEKNRAARNTNSIQELAADPLNLLSGGAAALTKTAKGGAIASKLNTAARETKALGWLFKGADFATSAKSTAIQKLTQTKAVKWLGAEHKTPEQALSEAIELAKKNQSVAQNTLLPRLKAIDKKLGSGKTDFSVFDDFAQLSDSEAKILQRMKAGKLTSTDRLMLAGKNNAPIRSKLEALASKWDDFAENMRLADNVKTTRFGKGKKTYSPHTAWVQGDLKKYNFRLKSKNPIQSQADFRQGAIDRYFKSSHNEVNDAKLGRLTAERDELVKRYDSTIGAERENVEKLYQRTKSPLNKVRKVVGAPTRLWKKSVLKYRPAWTVNNALYNTQAGVLAGGGGSLVEQAKMLNPRYWRKAMDESKVFKGNLGKEIGNTGRLNKFYSGVEDWSRVAAGRSALKKGLTEEQALKRVNRYLFDYTTKNWERPLKAAVPFWSFQKNLAKAAATMPFDRPLAAQAYNRLDRHQSQAFDKDFDTMIPKLKELGYSDDEIEGFRKDQSKYYAGKLKIGGKYINTPFNAFSEKGLGSLGFNPYLAAAGETAESVDSFGKTVKGNEASLIRRLTTKFPQAELGYKAYKGWRVDKGLDKPSTMYIGKKGSEGYGLTKEKQGYDPSKANYVTSMDPRTKNKQDLAAFLGKPRDTEFDKERFVQGKVYQKVTAEYFKKSATWKDMEFGKAEAERNALFKKYGVTADEFYKGILSKYDTDQTKQIKATKESAAKQNKSLFDEYGRQPKGTRNLWATEKLRELTASGYFDSNPFLKSFDWINPTTVGKADKQKAVKHALETGDWSQYKKLSGKTAKTAKALARDHAVATGDWSAYKAKYGVSAKSSPYQLEGKYFKTADSMQKYKDGLFWRKYIDADKSMRRRLLAENPEYNKRADWTDAQWDSWKIEDKAKKLAKLTAWRGDNIISKHVAENKSTATRYVSAQSSKKRSKKLVYA